MTHGTEIRLTGIAAALVVALGCMAMSPALAGYGGGGGGGGSSGSGSSGGSGPPTCRAGLVVDANNHCVQPTGAAASTGAAAKVLTAKNGMTVYVLDADVGGTPTCYGGCATKWPAYAAKSGQTMGEGWATTKRTDGSLQWTYDGKPLYFYFGDKKKGDENGDGIGGVWHVVID